MLQPYRNPSIGNYLGSSEILYFWGKFMNIVSIDCSYLRLNYTACKLNRGQKTLFLFTPLITPLPYVSHLRQTNCTYLLPTQVFNLNGCAAPPFVFK